MSERQTSAQPSDEESESYRGEDEGVMSSEEDEGVISNKEDEGEGRKSDGDKNDNDEDNIDEEALDSTWGAPGDDHPFILPKIWTVNDFLPMMLEKVFKILRECY